MMARINVKVPIRKLVDLVTLSNSKLSLGEDEIEQKEKDNLAPRKDNTNNTRGSERGSGEVEGELGCKRSNVGMR